MKKIIIMFLTLCTLASHGQITEDSASFIKRYRLELEEFNKNKREVDEEVSTFRKNLVRRSDAKLATAVKDLSGTLPVTSLCVNSVFEDGTNPWTEFCLKHSASNIYLPNGLTNVTCNPVTKNGSSASQHFIQIVPSGIDPFLISASPAFSLPTRPIGGGSNSLRIGNSANGFGAEMIAKNILVTNANKIFYFKYALVMQKSHSNLDGSPNGSEVFFSARAVDVAGNVVDEILQIGNPNNSFTQKTNSDAIYFMDWQCAKLDLSSKVGQTVKIEFMNSDCSAGGHWGYTYLDEFCVDCKPSEDATIKVDSCYKNNNVSGTFTAPSIGGVTGSLLSMELQFYNNGVPFGPLHTSYTTSGSNYSFASVTLPAGFTCLDVVVTAKFQIINPFSGASSILVKSTSNKDVTGKEIGNKPGVNNDICICCNCQQTLKPFLFWTTGTGSVTNDKQLPLTCGETFTDKLDCFQPYIIKINNPCGDNCLPDSIITKITYPGGSTAISYSLSGTTLIANQVGTYTISIKVKCGGKWCTECKITFKQTKKCDPFCDNCFVNGKEKVTVDFDDAASTATIVNYPGSTSLNTVFTLGGGADTYTDVRVNIVDFQISSDNPICLQCYTNTSHWGSMVSGSLPGFSGTVTSYPGVSATSPFNNPREIVFSSSPVSIPMPTKLNININVPGANPLSGCCIKIVLYMKVTYRNNKCEECNKVVRVGFTQCPAGSPVSPGSNGFDAATGWPQFKMHAPNADDAQLMNTTTETKQN